LAPRRIAVMLGVAGVVAGCGASAGDQHSAPRLPPALASGLAARSDALAGALEQGDFCRATQLAADLSQATHEAAATGRVPIVFLGRLLSTVDSLSAAVPACAPQRGQSENADVQAGDHDRGKHRGRGHGKHRGKP
jgi:hypothetical protein